MKKRNLFFLLVALSICISSCKTTVYAPKPVRKKKCNCPHFSEVTPSYQEVYAIAFYTDEQ